jgi:hypothetical protein
MATTYVVRMVEEDAKIVAYIDADGSPVIRQPSAPGMGDGATWASVNEAQAWANQHAADLTNYSIEGDKAKLESERRVAEGDALIIQAKEDSKKIAELYDMVKALLTK